MTHPIRSMTGFGEAEAELDVGRVRVEIRTVNHRYLNLQVRTPAGLDRVQPVVEEALRSKFARGHVKANVSIDASSGQDEAPVPVDLDRARGYRDALVRLQRELGLEGSVDVALLAGFRDVFRAPEEAGTASELPVRPLAELVRVAADAALRMREEEGARLADDLANRLDALDRELRAVEERAPERLVVERDRLRARIADLLEDQAAVDDERVAREVAHLAERWDIHEELVRFRSHLEMFRETLESGSPDGVGKRFGFIAQEILRETNTIGAKANDAIIAAHVVALKEDVERLREQLENVE